MAEFQCVEGAQGQGKSLDASRTARRLFERNKKWAKQGRPVRKICANITFSKAFRDEMGEFYQHWSDIKELCRLRDADIIWDEIANDLDARNFAMLSSEVKRFLSRARKRGLDIYANTQDFDMIDKRARTMMRRVFRMTKVIGSPDPSATKPEVKNVWGVFMKREFINFKNAAAVQDYAMRDYSWFPEEIFVLQQKDIAMYDTQEDLSSGEYPPLDHIVRRCENFGHDCNYKIVTHS